MILAGEGLAELHTHLGGSVASEILWSLAHEQGIALPVKDYWEFDSLVTVSDPRGVTPRSRRSGSSASSSGNRSCSSAPRPWKRTSAPSGSAAAGRVTDTRDSAIALISRPEPREGSAAE